MGGPSGPSANKKVGITKHSLRIATEISAAKASELPAGIASGNPKRTSFETALNLPMIGNPMVQRCADYTEFQRETQKPPKFATFNN